ncbi:MAG: hypothetical protein P8Y02_02950 [Deinococcales bacterium]|jgi:hypothetical protein
MTRLRLPTVTAILAIAISLAACGTQPDAVTLQPQNAPTFMPRIYADGKVWGTKGNSTLPAPNDNNQQSFDKLYKITNSNNPAGQLPVSEAGPGNPLYNGGRWSTHTAEWTTAAFTALGTVPVLTSYEDILQQQAQGHLTITQGDPSGAYPYFQCPLLPVKQH